MRGGANLKLVCRCKYRVRWFHSKGAFLVLLWCMLAGVAGSLLIKTLSVLSRDYDYWRILIPSLTAVPVFIISGWLADRKLGNYKVAKFGYFALFLGSLSVSVYTLIDYQLNINQYVAGISLCLFSSLIVLGLACFGVAALKLGIDQMPDASSSSITSFIAWFVFSAFISLWTSNVTFTSFQHLNINAKNLLQIQSMLPAFCLSVVLITDFLLAKEWLIIEPKSPQSLKTIYQVLKFAAKHKSPLYRSALTYWEEDIPSRLDLGKSKYGGPFTTEQVEDVKTTFRLLALSSSLWIISFSLYLNPVEITFLPFNFPTLSPSNSFLLSKFTFSTEWCAVITSLVYEFIIYPLLGNRIPRIVVRIGIFSAIGAVFSLLFLILELIPNSDNEATIWAVHILISVSHGVLISLLFCAVLEFVVAQTPYNMRGLSTGFMSMLIVSSIAIGSCLSEYSDKFCSDCNNTVIIFSVNLAVSLIGFILYCLLACWYKRRVRDDVYDTHRVEEVYDRYLTAEVAQRRNRFVN